MANNQVAHREYYTKLGDTLFTSQQKVREFFDELIKSQGEIILQHKGEARVSIVTADTSYNRFTKVHETVYHYGKPVELSTTINYSEVMNFDIKLTTEEGEMERVKIE